MPIAKNSRSVNGGWSGGGGITNPQYQGYCSCALGASGVQSHPNILKLSNYNVQDQPRHSSNADQFPPNATRFLVVFPLPIEASQMKLFQNLNTIPKRCCRRAPNQLGAWEAKHVSSAPESR